MSWQRVLGESGPSRKVNVIIGTIHQSHHVLMNGGLNAALFQVDGLLFVILAFAVEGGFALYVFGIERVIMSLPSPNHFPLP